MTLKEMNVPLTWALAAILFTISSVITIEFRYAKAGSIEKLNTTVQVSSRENRLLILQMQMFRAQSDSEKQFIQAQIDQLLRELEELRDK